MLNEQYNTIETVLRQYKMGRHPCLTTDEMDKLGMKLPLDESWYIDLAKDSLMKHKDTVIMHPDYHIFALLEQYDINKQPKGTFRITNMVIK